MNSKVGNISLPLKKPNELGKKPYSDRLSRLIDEVISLSHSLQPGLELEFLGQKTLCIWNANSSMRPTKSVTIT